MRAHAASGLRQRRGRASSKRTWHWLQVAAQHPNSTSTACMLRSMHRAILASRNARRSASLINVDVVPGIPACLASQPGPERRQFTSTLRWPAVAGDVPVWIELGAVASWGRVGRSAILL